ncbi:hypothetical protein ACP4OV_013727 [Aristida adscensionis]
MVRAADLPSASRRLPSRSPPLEPPGGARPLDDHPGRRGAEDPRGHGAPRFDGQPQPPDHRGGRGGPGGFPAPAPPPGARAGCRRDAPGVAPPPAPDRRMSTGTSSRRPRHRGASPPARSPRGERRREHRHCARGESSRSRSPHLRLPLGGSKREPSSKRYRLEDGRKSSSSGAGMMMMIKMELAAGTAMVITLKLALHHKPLKKLPSRLPIVMSRLDDGYKSPSSPTYRCEDELEDVGKGTHGDCGDENCDPDWLDRAGASDAPESEITGRVPDFKHEDSSYDALVDNFMDAVLKNWREPVYPNVSVSEEAFQNQTKRFAELALKRYNKNKNNKVKYSLVEAITSAGFFEDYDLYGHVNFFANAKNGPKVLVFAELHQVGSRPNSMILTSFHVLDEKWQFCLDGFIKLGALASLRIGIFLIVMLVVMTSNILMDHVTRQAILSMSGVTVVIRYGNRFGFGGSFT